MKKLLLSAALIVASGTYVAYENYGTQAVTLDSTIDSAPPVASTAPAALDPRTAVPTIDTAPAHIAPDSPPTAAALVPAQSMAKPARKIASAATASRSVNGDPIGAVIAYATPTQPLPPMPAAAGSSPSANEAVASVMPLPRPRPAEAPQTAVATAAIVPTSDVLPAQEVAATQNVAQAQEAYRNGTYKGVSANAYYGRVQVEAIVRGGRLTSIKILAAPNDRSRSRYIANYSLPVLEQESISAQSASIDTVSGATLTSEAFIQSLDSALSAARADGNNA